MEKAKKLLMDTVSIFIGVAILAIILPPLAFIAGFIVNQIVDAAKYGWSLW